MGLWWFTFSTAVSHNREIEERGLCWNERKLIFKLFYCVTWSSIVHWSTQKNQKPKNMILKLFTFSIIAKEPEQAGHPDILNLVCDSCFSNISKNGVNSSALTPVDRFRVSEVGTESGCRLIYTQNESILSVFEQILRGCRLLSIFCWFHCFWLLLLLCCWENSLWGPPSRKSRERRRESTETQWRESIPCKWGFSASPCTLCLRKATLSLSTFFLGMFMYLVFISWYSAVPLWIFHGHKTHC